MWCYHYYSHTFKCVCLQHAIKPSCSIKKRKRRNNPHEIYTIKNRVTIRSRVINLNVAVSIKKNATHHAGSIPHFATSFFEILSLFFFPILRNQPSIKRTRKHLHCQYTQSFPDPNPCHSRTHPLKCHLGRDIEPVQSDGSAIWLTIQNIHLESSECYTVTP